MRTRKKTLRKQRSMASLLEELRQLSSSLNKIHMIVKKAPSLTSPVPSGLDTLQLMFLDDDNMLPIGGIVKNEEGRFVFFEDRATSVCLDSTSVVYVKPRSLVQRDMKIGDVVTVVDPGHNVAYFTTGDFAEIYHVKGDEIKLLDKSGGVVTFDKSQLALD